MGIDLAERASFSHLDPAAIDRTAARWLRADERAWCAARPSFREAMVIVLSCKEAVFKASGGAGVLHEISLRMGGRETVGWAVMRGRSQVQVLASWELSSDAVLSLALAGTSIGAARQVLDQIRENLRLQPTP